MYETSETSEGNVRDPRVDQLLIALETGATLEEASKIIGVTSRQVRYWRAADPELEAAVREAMIDADDQVEAATFKNCLDLDPANNALRMFWLKTRRSKVYLETTKQIHEFADLPDDELVRRATRALQGIAPQGS